MFHPGQHVLCVIDTSAWAALYPTVRFPRSGAVYAVRAVVIGGGFSGEDDVEGLYLDEIRNDPLPGDEVEPAFASRGFRPLATSALDVFRAALVTPPRQPTPDGGLSEDERRKVAGWEVA